MTALRAWIDARSLREKRLLLVMAALMVVTLVWGGIVRPVRDALSSTAERYDAAIVRVGEAEAAVAAIRAAGSAVVPAATLADTVRARADQAGFALAELTDEAPGRVRVRIASARPAALTGWLAALEARGILVRQATLSDNGDRTVAAALVLGARGS